MADKTELSVSVKADIDNLLQNMGKGLKSVQDFKDQLARFKTSLDKATDPASVIRLNKAIEAAQNRIKAISSAGLGAGANLNKLSVGSNTAAQSLTNLGRVAQDAPFGFIGIQNNINPLLESFQRLQAESKATGTSLKSNIIGALAGGAGLGLAVSVVTGLLTVLAQKGFFNTKKAADEAAKATKEFNESLKEVESQGLATGIKLQTFVNIAKDQTQSIKTRNEALKQANKIFGEHGEKLDLVNIATAAVTEQINKFTQATIQQALATKFTDRAADLMIAQRDATKSYGVELAKLQVLEKKQQSTISATGEERITAAGAATDKQRIKVVALANAYRGVTFELKDIFSQLQDAQVQAAKLFGELGNKTKGQTDGAKKEIKSIGDVIDEMRKKIALLNKEEIGFSTDNAQERYSTFLSAIKELNLKFGQKLDGDLLKGLFDEAKFAKLGFIVQDGFARLGVAAVRAFRDEMKNLTMTEPVIITFQMVPIEKGVNGRNQEDLQKLFGIPQLSADRFQQEAFLLGQGMSKAFTDGMKDMNDAEFADFLDATVKRMQDNQAASAEIFATLGESLGKGIATGSKFLSEAFSGILNIMGSYLVQLGKAAILQSKLITAITAGNPITGFASGLIAVIAGSILKNIKLPAFANGVQNFSGGLAMVGERGPELVNLPRGSDVIPNHDLSGFGGGQSIRVSGEFELRNDRLIAAVRRGERTSSRQS